jgi:hypothetical protein
MPRFEFTLMAILREREDGLSLAEAPGFPEVSRLGDEFLTIASSVAAGVARGGRAKYAPGIGPTVGRRYRTPVARRRDRHHRADQCSVSDLGPPVGLPAEAGPAGIGRSGRAGRAADRTGRTDPGPLARRIRYVRVLTNLTARVELASFPSSMPVPG